MPRRPTLHDLIARDTFPNGATLTCENCCGSVVADAASAARYLAIGWPSCCGRVMRVTIALA